MASYTVVYRGGEDSEVELVAKTLTGDYVERGFNHDRKVYVRHSGGHAVYVYYWDDRDGVCFEGWWFGEEAGGSNVYAHHPGNVAEPPASGWRIHESAPSGALGIIRKDRSSATPGEPPRARNLRKKLNRLIELQRQATEGDFTASEELDKKLARQGEIEEELQAVLEAAALEVANTQAATVSTRGSDGEQQDNEDCSWSKSSLTMSRPYLSRTLSGCSAGGFRSPSMRWQDDPVSVEDIEIPLSQVAAVAAAREAETFEFLEAVQPFSAATQGNERLRRIIQEVSELSKDAFEEDCLEMVSRKGKWKLTLLVQKDGASQKKDKGSATPSTATSSTLLEPEHMVPPLQLDGKVETFDEPPLIGFVVYRLRPDHHAFAIAKLAIIPEHRGKGYGCKMMDWCIRFAKKQQHSVVQYITLSSLPDAVRFYKKLGFRAVDVKLGQGCGPDEEYVEGQVYMEYRMKGKAGGAGQKKKNR